jgi:cytoskeletal protein CcmA (bactofilin family)
MTAARPDDSPTRRQVEAAIMSEMDPNELVDDALDERPMATESETTARSATGELVLIPAGGSFEGQVALIGPTRIDGSVRGSLRGTGDLVVGAGARIEGRVECDSISSEGEIQGPVSVRTRARFGAGARLDGDLHAPVVYLDENAIWNGRAIVGGCVAPESESAGS